MKKRVGIHGAGGRMGQQLVRLLEHHAELELCAAIVQSGDPLCGKQVFLDRTAGPVYTSDLAAGLPVCDVVIDFSTREGTALLLAEVARFPCPLVIGTTGLDGDTEEDIVRLAQRVPILKAPNFSLGIAVLTKLVRDTAAMLSSWDMEIVELHHRRKQDAPSGTALQLANNMLDASSEKKTTLCGRRGTNAHRMQDEIGLNAVRGGDVVGEHTVFFLGDGERLELIHRANDRIIFARGALHAAAWLLQHGTPGKILSMKDIL